MSLRGLPQKAVAISVVGGVMRSPRFARDDRGSFDKLRMSGENGVKIPLNLPLRKGEVSSFDRLRVSALLNDLK